MGSRSLIPAALIVSAIVLIGLAANCAYAQRLVVGIVKEDVGPVRVYRAYQYIDIVLYLYVDPDARLRVTEAWALLSNPSASISVNLTSISLAEPVSVVYANETYSVSTLLVGRIPASLALTPGPSTLRIVVNGTATLGGTTYYINFSKTYTIAVLDHIPVDSARMEAYRAAERIKMLFTLATVLGAHPPVEAGEVEALLKALRDADSALYAGDVDSALAVYEDTISRSSTYESLIMAALALRASSIDRSLTALNASLSTNVDYLTELVRSVNASLSHGLDSLGRDVSRSLGELSEGLNVLARQLAEAVSESSRVSKDAVEGLQTQITQLSRQVSELRNSIDSSLRSIDERVSALSDAVSSLSSAHRDLADTVNMLQTALIVVSVALLVVAAIPLALRKK